MNYTRLLLDPSLDVSIKDIYEKLYKYLGYNFDIVVNITKGIYSTLYSISSYKHGIIVPHFDYKKELDIYLYNRRLRLCKHHNIEKKFTYKCRVCELIYCIQCDDVIDIDRTQPCPRCTHKTCLNIKYDVLLTHIENLSYYYCISCKNLYYLYNYQSHINCNHITNNIFIKARYILNELNKSTNKRF